MCAVPCTFTLSHSMSALFLTRKRERDLGSFENRENLINLLSLGTLGLLIKKKLTWIIILIKCLLKLSIKRRDKMKIFHIKSRPF